MLYAKVCVYDKIYIILKKLTYVKDYHKLNAFLMKKNFIKYLHQKLNIDDK